MLVYQRVYCQKIYRCWSPCLTPLSYPYPRRMKFPRWGWYESRQSVAEGFVVVNFRTMKRWKNAVLWNSVFHYVGLCFGRVYCGVFSVEAVLERFDLMKSCSRKPCCGSVSFVDQICRFWRYHWPFFQIHDALVTAGLSRLQQKQTSRSERCCDDGGYEVVHGKYP